MLDHDHRIFHFIMNASDELDEFFTLIFVHSGSGFIQKKKIGTGRHGPRHFEPALQSIGQTGGSFIGMFFQVHHFQQFMGSSTCIRLDSLSVRRADEGLRQRIARRIVQTQLHVFICS